MWAGLGGLGGLRYQKSEGDSMFSMARGLFPDSLTKICDLTNTPTERELFFSHLKASFHVFLSKLKVLADTIDKKFVLQNCNIFSVYGFTLKSSK